MSEAAETTRETKSSAFDTIKALALAVVLALGIRSFLFEPFKIPSGSMIPTLLVGDYIVVNKLAYGIRMPLTGALLIDLGAPRRGDVVVFRYPDDPNIDFIKRVVGIPGDTIRIREGRLLVNGQLVDRIDEGTYEYIDYQRRSAVETERFREINADGAEYTIIQDPKRPPSHPRGPWVVPKDMYFMMGDNRDNSRDSRVWSHHFVASHQLKGRAMFVHWSWVISSEPAVDRGFLADLLYTLFRVVTFQVEEIRWERIGRSVHGVAD